MKRKKNEMELQLALIAMGDDERCKPCSGFSPITSIFRMNRSVVIAFIRLG